MAEARAARRLPASALVGGEFTSWLRHGGDGDPSALLVARSGGRVTGSATLTLPQWDNHHIALLQVVVDPYQRRQGIGRALCAAAVAGAAAAVAPDRQRRDQRAHDPGQRVPRVRSRRRAGGVAAARVTA